MTGAELMMWPRVNRWGSRRREELIHHIDLCTTLLPDEDTCVFWADIMAESLTAADAWVAATALQFDLVVVTADYHDFEHLDGLTLIPVSG